ncbi:hypothetical protein FHS60_000364 [Alloprevotella rava]|uniref:Uncharacterized protein n=1 Tax=Alloprevotella rava TaxID=671218 RepID=A0A7W5UKW8_9BACT|nr:hypothetical protein [Alloprevotella rava]
MNRRGVPTNDSSLIINCGLNEIYLSMSGTT